MSLNITIYGDEGRSSTRPLESYMKVALRDKEFDLGSANLHIKVLLRLVKEGAKEVYDMIENDDQYMILRLQSSTSKTDFNAKLFKDYTIGMHDENVVLKMVKQEGQISNTIGVFRSEDMFNSILKSYEKNDTLNTSFSNITIKEIEAMI